MVNGISMAKIGENIWRRELLPQFMITTNSHEICTQMFLIYKLPDVARHIFWTVVESVSAMVTASLVAKIGGKSCVANYCPVVFSPILRARFGT